MVDNMYSEWGKTFTKFRTGFVVHAGEDKIMKYAGLLFEGLLQ